MLFLLGVTGHITILLIPVLIENNSINSNFKIRATIKYKLLYEWSYTKSKLYFNEIM